MLTLAAFAVVSATMLFGLMRRWFSAAGLAVGALVIPVLLAAAVTVVVPLGAMNLQWPGLAACVGALVLVGAPRRGPVAFWRWLVIVLTAVPVVLVLTPLVEAIWLAMSLELAPVIAVLIGLTALLLLPAMEMVGEARWWWWAPLSGGLAGAAFQAVGVWMAEPTAERPAPSTLLYVLIGKTDRPTGRWTRRATTPIPGWCGRRNAWGRSVRHARSKASVDGISATGLPRPPL